MKFKISPYFFHIGDFHLKNINYSNFVVFLDFYIFKLESIVYNYYAVFYHIITTIRYF